MADQKQPRDLTERMVEDAQHIGYLCYAKGVDPETDLELRDGWAVGELVASAGKYGTSTYLGDGARVRIGNRKTDERTLEHRTEQVRQVIAETYQKRLETDAARPLTYWAEQASAATVEAKAREQVATILRGACEQLEAMVGEGKRTYALWDLGRLYQKQEREAEKAAERLAKARQQVRERWEGHYSREYVPILALPLDKQRPALAKQYEEAVDAIDLDKQVASREGGWYEGLTADRDWYYELIADAETVEEAEQTLAATERQDGEQDPDRQAGREAAYERWEREYKAELLRERTRYEQLDERDRYCPSCQEPRSGDEDGCCFVCGSSLVRQRVEQAVG